MGVQIKKYSLIPTQLEYFGSYLKNRYLVFLMDKKCVLICIGSQFYANKLAILIYPINLKSLYSDFPNR